MPEDERAYLAAEAAKVAAETEPNEPRRDGQRAILDLQLQFAAEIVEKTGKSLPDVLFEFTRFYKAFGLPKPNDPNNAIWKEYVDGLNTHPILDWTLSFMERGKTTNPENQQFGCFRFDYEEETRNVKIHFGNNDPSPHGPLSKEQMDERIKELTAMFGYIKEHCKDAKTVEGNSWLYNRKEYRRLFPDSYTKIMEPDLTNFRSGSLWGQFVKSEGGIDTKAKAEMLQKVRDIPPDELTAERLADCFENKIQMVRGSIEDFYKMYGIA
ncbi:MAG: hypothetical protein AAB865_03175 [Patescibacteria group bacterium]|mgnify:CR=1 FL=1